PAGGATVRQARSALDRARRQRASVRLSVDRDGVRRLRGDLGRSTRSHVAELEARTPAAAHAAWRGRGTRGPEPPRLYAGPGQSAPGGAACAERADRPERSE